MPIGANMFTTGAVAMQQLARSASEAAPTDRSHHGAHGADAARRRASHRSSRSTE
jgi:hypothetical protein